MTLVPVTGILATVSKLERESPAAARALVIQGLYESLCDQADALRPVLEPVMLREMGEISKEARASLTRASVAKAFATGELHGQEQSDALDAIDDYVAKGLIGTLLNAFNDRHPRDEKGRFIRVDVHPEGTNRHTVRHSSHQQTRDKVKEMQRLGMLRPDTRIAIHSRKTDDTGHFFTPEVKNQTTPKDLEDTLANMSAKQSVTGISVRRKHMPKSDAKHQAGLDIIGMATGQDDLGAQRLMNRIERTDLGSSEHISGQWNAPSQGGTDNDRQAYRRLKLTGTALAGMSTPGSLPHVAGGLAQLIGEIGPEAEKVLSPGIRRAAYRYRGTERRPDADLRAQVKEGQDFVEGKGEWSQDRRSNPAAAVGMFYAKDKISRDQADFLVGGDTTVAWMLGLTGAPSQLPNQDQAELSMASGEVPPSRGVILDADGDLVSQAVGFNGDHYLPFDLRNLGRLYGGQYIRTRATGGPTGEDLYTSIMTGARQFQVVSRSGVFTVQLDPNLRGARRYSDKARSMVQRYEAMLSTIAGGKSGLYERDLSNEERTKIRRQAAADSDTPEEFRSQVTLLENRARTMGALANEEGDNNDAMEEATRLARADLLEEVKNTPRNVQHSDQRKLQLLAEFRDKHYAELTGGQVKPISLNGAGYERALKALQQEFPYFIRGAEWRPLPEWIKERGLPNPGFKHDRANDRTHVTPGQTNPELGLTGANARRRVAGLGENKAVREETPEETQQAGFGGAAQPAAAAAAAATPKAKAKTTDFSEAALLGKPTKVFYALTNASAKLVGIAAGMTPVAPYQGDPNSIADEPDSHTYINARANRILNTGDAWNSGERFLKWFLSADPAEQSKVLRAFEHLDTVAVDYPGITTPEAARDLHDAFVDTLNLVRPYATVSDPDKVAESFVYGDRPKPASPEAFGVSLSTSATPEEVARVISRVSSSDPKVGKLITAMSGEDEVERGEAAKAAKDRYGNSGDDKDYKQLGRVHLAWSLLHTRDVGNQIRKLMGTDAAPLAPGAAPTKPVKKADRPRRVIVHKASDPFTRRTLAALGIG